MLQKNMPLRGTGGTEKKQILETKFVPLTGKKMDVFNNVRATLFEPYSREIQRFSKCYISH